jgi:hypothetical protein
MTSLTRIAVSSQIAETAHALSRNEGTNKAAIRSLNIADLDRFNPRPPGISRGGWFGGVSAGCAGWAGLSGGGWISGGPDGGTPGGGCEGCGWAGWGTSVGVPARRCMRC